VLRYNQADLASGTEIETPVAQVLKHNFRNTDTEDKFRNTSEEGVLHT
jgi:hypothetical protein